jgi:hypothetical protein
LRVAYSPSFEVCIHIPLGFGGEFSLNWSYSVTRGFQSLYANIVVLKCFEGYTMIYSMTLTYFNIIVVPTFVNYLV